MDRRRRRIELTDNGIEKIAHAQALNGSMRMREALVRDGVAVVGFGHVPATAPVAVNRRRRHGIGEAAFDVGHHQIKAAGPIPRNPGINKEIAIYRVA